MPKTTRRHGSVPLASRIILILFVVFICFTLVDFLIQRQVVYRSFLELERREAQEDLSRCVEAIGREVEHLRLLCNDWAAWDDTYEFVLSGAPEYVAGNLVEETFHANRLDLFYVCDLEGRVVWGKVWDRGRGEAVSVEEFPPDRLPDDHPLGPGAVGWGVAGTYITSRGPMLVAALPILRSTTRGPSRGVVIMGRAIDEELIAALSRQARVRMHVWPAQEQAVPAATRPALETLHTAAAGAAAVATRDKLLVHTLVADVEGRPALLLRADVAREITRRGRMALNYASASVLQLGLLILCVALVLLRRSVISPVVALTERMEAFGGGGEDDEARETARVARRNELDVLADEFDRMTRQVTEARARLLEQAAELERGNVRLQRDIEARRAVEAELRAREGQLRELASELTLTEQRERRRIAELLHDQMGQALAMAKLRLQAIHQQAPQQAEALAGVIAMLDQVIGQCRSLTFELSPPVLHELGLEAALEWLAETAREGGLTCEFHDDGRDKALPEDVRVLLFSAARELLTNVIKHARARRATLAIAREGDSVVVTVTDDGIGFTADGTNGFGLFNIRERLGRLGGDLTVETPPNGGARVTMTMPLRAPDHPTEVSRDAHEDHPGR